MKHWYTTAPEKPQTKQFNILLSTTQVMSRVGNLASNMERWKRQPSGADEKPRKCMLTRLWGQHLRCVQDKTRLYESPHHDDRNCRKGKLSAFRLFSTEQKNQRRENKCQEQGPESSTGMFHLSHGSRWNWSLIQWRQYLHTFFPQVRALWTTCLCHTEVKIVSTTAMWL